MHVLTGCEPAHVGLIPDGMRRWAKSRGISLAESYLQGAEKVADILQVLRGHHVRTVTVYNLSRANLARSQAELEPVFNASIHFLTHLIPARFEPDACSVRLYGDRSLLPAEYVAAAEHAESVMRGEDFRINILAAYDANDELRAAVAQAQQQGGEGTASSGISVKASTPGRSTRSAATTSPGC